MNETVKISREMESLDKTRIFLLEKISKLHVYPILFLVFFQAVTLGML